MKQEWMKNKEKKNLEDFRISQLNVLLQHLRLGPDHLKRLLTPSQFQDLLDWCNLAEKHAKQIATDRMEKLGNMSLIINTILTSTFGAWMGLSGCIGYRLGSLTTLTLIATLAFFVSGSIGYMSLRVTQRQAKNAIDRQVIHQFQLKVLKAINQKMREKIKAITFYLYTGLFILENKKEDMQPSNELPQVTFQSTEETYQWYDRLIQALQMRLEEVRAPYYRTLYQKQIDEMGYLIKKTFAKHMQFLENLRKSEQLEKKRLQIMPALPFLKILTNPSFNLPKAPSQYSWIKQQLSFLLLGIIPTIWGGFASMFVFVGGIPNIARELNLLEVEAFLTNPFARMVEISLAILITCYFAFAFLYSSRKSWQREQLRRKIEKEILHEDALIMENSHLLNMLAKVKVYTQKLILIFTIVKRINQDLTTPSA